MSDTPLFAASKAPTERDDSKQDDSIQSGSEQDSHKIVIVDGHALAFRSYYAIRQLSTSRGQAVNAVYGFLRSLLRLLQDEGQFDATVVTFDAPAKTFRHEAYADYKAKRAPTPEDLPAQIMLIKELVELLGLYQIEQAGLEADDLFGSIAKACEAQGYRVDIFTTDRDAYQLISERVHVVDPIKGSRFGPAEVAAKYGVRVEQWVDYRALTGDSSDNIPGAKGIGPKTAATLLQRYDSLDAMFAQLDSLEPTSARKKLQASLEDVRFSRELSTIVTDAPLEIDPQRWAAPHMQREKLREKLQELEFRSLLRELGLDDLDSTTETARRDYESSDWQSLSTAHSDGQLGYVLSASPMQADALTLALAAEQQVACSPDIKSSMAFLANSSALHACDVKALRVFCLRHGLPCACGDDPLLMAYVLDPSNSDPESVAQRYDAGAWTADPASRAVVAARLQQQLAPALQGKQAELYYELEKPLLELLAAMEYRGVRVDSQLLHDQAQAMQATLHDLEQQVRAIADNPGLNLNSRDQLAELLYDKLGLSSGKRTSTGKRSTAVSALEPLREKHEVVGLILEYRELAKLHNTYLAPLPKLVHPDTGRIHSSFNQTVVATGRLSSTNPNLQNIPVRSQLGRNIRQAFIAAEGHCLLVADYSQIELRILAHVAQEPALIEAFQAAEDIHSRTAAQIHGVSLAEVDSSMRRVAKIINFGVLYGMSAHRLAGELSIPYDEADSFIRTYFQRYPKVQAYIDATLAFAREHGYVETMLGRRRHIPDIKASNRNLREYAERTAYNMPIQGAAADIIKRAMLQLAPKLERQQAHLLLQVHDELIIEAPLEHADTLKALVQETMEQAYALDVPLVAEVGMGKNWLEAKA